VAVYDPYAGVFTDIIEFPGITRTGSEHIGGVAWDPYTNFITILVDSAAPWATAGANVSGDNLVIKYDAATKQILWTANLTAVTDGKYGGFQDVETDARGNTYVVGTWPGSIMRVSKDGADIIPWVPPTTTSTTQAGYGGLVALGDLLLSNDRDGRLYRFDMRDSTGTRVLVPMTPEVLYDDNDAIYAPPMYGGKVLLLASHSAGIEVLYSADAKWSCAEYLGTIPNPTGSLYTGSATVAAVQMGPDRTYLVDDWLGDPWVDGQVAGNRTLFPFPDITEEIDKMLP